MRNRVGAAFVTGGAISNGKETAMTAILSAMIINQMIIVSGGGAFGASATTGPESPGIDDKELATARALGKRVAESLSSPSGVQRRRIAGIRHTTLIEPGKDSGTPPRRPICADRKAAQAHARPRLEARSRPRQPSLAGPFTATTQLPRLIA
jgi:hypothetical protein